MENNIASRLKQAMKGTNANKLATSTGLNQQTIQRYLNGERTPNGESIPILCSALGITADYLLGIGNPGTDPPQILAEHPTAYNTGHEPCPNCAAKDLTIAHLAATLEHLTKAKK